jgi:sugar O-acyltransferase (sialic acid O-acetyltransferase NeuD family)
MTDKLDIVIVGAGGFGREVHVMLDDVFPSDEYQFKGFLADQSNELAEALGPTIGSPDDYQPEPNDRFILAIGYMDVRERLTCTLEGRGAIFAEFIHPLAFVAKNAQIGAGAVIFPYAVVSNAAVVGNHVHLNYYACVGHDAQVGRCSLLAPYATLNGFSSIGKAVYLSTHSTIVVNKHVADHVKVSANSTVQHDVPAHSFVFGVPGRVMRKGAMG